MEEKCPYRLLYSLPDQDPVEFPLSVGEYVLGRSTECDIPLQALEVSRKHARINVFPEGQVWLTDLGSANGTQLDENPLRPRKASEVLPGQIFKIGPYQLTIKTAEALAVVPEPSGAEDFSEHETRFEAAVQPVGDMHTRVIVSETPETKVEVPPILCRLKVQRGTATPQEYILKEGNWQIGREANCDIQLDDPFVSRRHGLITVSGKTITIVDQGSSNGINMNGRKMDPHQPYPLTPGDKINIGQFNLALELIAEAAAAKTKECEPPVPQVPVQNLISVSKPLNLMGLEKVSIGRAEDNHIVIKHPMVSRYHAIIERMGTRYRINDLHSANGVFINDEQIEGMAWLKEGDVIKVGPYSFNFTGTLIQQSSAEGYTIDVVDLKKYVTKTLNLLQDINLHIGQNEFVALVGMSGAGKSTLQDAINGYRPATHGQVLVNGTDLYKNYDMFRNDIGYVPQRDIVHMELTPYKSLEYCAKLRMPADTTVAEREAAINQTLEDLGLYERKDIPNSRLSGGQLKRVSIGVELLTRPKLFFLDEPTSGLDPGTEYEMMKLMRRLADQGRTIMLITHATKNVMLCDKVIILARGGNLAYFGAPENALDFFDKYRTPRERLEKDMEFDDIYRILEDDEKGTPEEWAKRYEEYRSKSKALLKAQVSKRSSASAKPIPKSRIKRISGIKQFLILSSRNTRILLQDKVSLLMLIVLAPALGIMNFIWGPDLFDPVEGSVSNIMSMWFMTAVMGILVGSLSSVREIVKELDIYKRERAVGLKILPYTLSKLWIGAVLSLYSAGAILLFLVLLVQPGVSNIFSYISFFITLALATFAGYLLGLVISAGVPNQNAALILLIAVLVPQLLFSGVLIPLENIPFGNTISSFISTRWAFEGFVKSTGMGDPLVADNCWQLPREERQALEENEKAACLCLGPNIFVTCGTVPGILTEDFYDDEAKAALAQAGPSKPIEPTSLPSPTPIPSPTPMPSPTAYPTPTSLPRSQDMQAYMDDTAQQQSDYFDGRIEQLDAYQQEIKDVTNDWADAQSDQMEVYADESQSQYEVYADDMEIYGDNLAEWEKERQSAIGAAESILTRIYDDYGRAFKGSVITRWVYNGTLCLIMYFMILFFQKRKDVV